MIAKDVSVGLTYEVLVSDKLVPVKLTAPCNWGGGWYGTNLATGHKVRIKTAGRLRKQLDGEIAATAEAAKQEATTTQIHTTTMEATVPATSNTAKKSTTDRTAAKQARAARRANSAPATTVHNPEASTVKPAAKSNTTPKESTVSKTTKSPAKPAAKRTPRSAANGKVTITASKPAAKRTPRKATAPVLAAAPVEVDIDAIVAAAVAEALAKAAPAATVKRTAKPKATVKPVVVTLKAGEPKVNSYSFKYNGKDETPLVTATYIMIPLLERFAQDGTPVEIAFTEYKPVGKQKPQPKSKIRYSGSEDTIRDLYVDRAAITKLGYTESNAPVVTVEVGKNNTVILTFQPA